MKTVTFFNNNRMPFHVEPLLFSYMQTFVVDFNFLSAMTSPFKSIFPFRSYILSMMASCDPALLCSLLGTK